MPGHRIPKRLGLHRQAGIALYRALLTQCRAVPLPDECKDVLQNTVRNRFWHNRDQISPRFVKLSFHVGYKALDLLDAAASGDAGSSERLSAYVARMPRSVSAPPVKASVKSNKRVRGSEAFETPPEKKFLNVFPRPDEEVPAQNRDRFGVRRVPVLVNAQGVPFVRFKRYQPRNVSRVIRQRAAAYFNRSVDVAWHDNYWVPLAQYEDQWEGMVTQQQRREGVSAPEDDACVDYEHPVRESAGLLVRSWKAEQRRTIEMSERMTRIVQAEAEMAKQERRRMGLESEGVKTKAPRKEI